MSMLLGFRSEILDTADALEPRNLHNGATWPYPPVMIMRILDDEKEVVERCNKTIEVMQERVRTRMPPRDTFSVSRVRVGLPYPNHMTPRVKHILVAERRLPSAAAKPARAWGDQVHALMSSAVVYAKSILGDAQLVGKRYGMPLEVYAGCGCAPPPYCICTLSSARRSA